MVADQMRFMQGCPAQTIADVVAMLSRIRGKLLAILDLRSNRSVEKKIEC